MSLCVLKWILHKKMSIFMQLLWDSNTKEKVSSYKCLRGFHGLLWGIMVNMVLCVIPGQGNSKILNLVKSGSFDSPIFLYIPNDEKTSTGHLI